MFGVGLVVTVVALWYSTRQVVLQDFIGQLTSYDLIWIVPASLVYLVSPIDFVPDVIPGLGQLDDLAVIVIGVKLFIELCPPEIVRQHLQELLGEANWRVEPNPSGPPPPPNVVDAPYEIKKDE